MALQVIQMRQTADVQSSRELRALEASDHPSRCVADTSLDAAALHSAGDGHQRFEQVNQSSDRGPCNRPAVESTTAGGEGSRAQRKLLTWRLEDLLADETAHLDGIGTDARQGALAARRERQPVVVVASLLDKATNLGGVCRTAEVGAHSQNNLSLCHA